MENPREDLHSDSWKSNDEWGWFKDGNENTDLKYVGEIRHGVPNGQGTYRHLDGYK